MRLILVLDLILYTNIEYITYTFNTGMSVSDCVKILDPQQHCIYYLDFLKSYALCIPLLHF